MLLFHHRPQELNEIMIYYVGLVWAKWYKIATYRVTVSLGKSDGTRVNPCLEQSTTAPPEAQEQERGHEAVASTASEVIKTRPTTKNFHIFLLFKNDSLLV